MSNIDKQAHKMRNYLNTAVISGMKLLHLTTDELSALLDELEAKDRKILKLEKLAEAESVGADKAATSGVEWMKLYHAAEKRIAELELREVVLPQCYSMLHRVNFDEPYHTEMVYRQHQVLEALHNAGINVTEACKGEAS